MGPLIWVSFNTDSWIDDLVTLGVMCVSVKKTVSDKGHLKLILYWEFFND